MLDKKTLKYVRVFFYASIVWIALGVVHLSSLYMEELNHVSFKSPQREQWILFILVYFSWSFLTTFIYYLIEKYPPNRDSFIWLWWLSFTAIIWLIVVVVIKQYLVDFLWGYPLVGVVKALQNESPFLYVFNFLKVITAYGVCTGVFYYLREKEAKFALLNLRYEAAEALEKKTRLELQVLQSQLSPHFLFNCLNAISSFSRSNENEKVIKTIAYLADILRYAIEGAKKNTVVLDDELNFTKNYLFIQSLRFEGCFNYRVSIDLIDDFIFIPTFCIQTLVENVFSHNELHRANPISIYVSIKQEIDCLKISVKNSPLMPTNGDGAGIGLNNLKARINLIYGQKAELLICKEAESFLVTIILPMLDEND